MSFKNRKGEDFTNSKLSKIRLPILLICILLIIVLISFIIKSNSFSGLNNFN